MYKYLSSGKSEYVLSKQVLRSGTSIGALVHEGKYAESKSDFVHKYAIAQKECSETCYWLKLLYESEFISLAEYESLIFDAEELMKMLTSSIITAKKNIKNHR